MNHTVLMGCMKDDKLPGVGSCWHVSMMIRSVTPTYHEKLSLLVLFQNK